MLSFFIGVVLVNWLTHSVNFGKIRSSELGLPLQINEITLLLLLLLLYTASGVYEGRF